MVKIGIICGTGLDNLNFLLEGKPKLKLLGPIDSSYGMSSDLIIGEKIEGIDVVFLSRHGQQHTLNSTSVNYRANLHALVDKLHCEAIVASGVLHASMHQAFSKPLRTVLTAAARKEKLTIHERATSITTEGPRLPSPAELKMFKTLGGDVMDQTTVPEVILAKELGIPYAVLGFITEAIPKMVMPGDGEDGEESAYRLDDNEVLLESVLKYSPLFMRTVLRALPEIASIDLAALRNPQKPVV